MPRDFRFGRRMKLPSTVEIIHELKMMMAADRAERALDAKLAKDKALTFRMRRPGTPFSAPLDRWENEGGAPSRPTKPSKIVPASRDTRPA